VNPKPDEETHRGQGAVLGVRVLRYSGVQGVTLAGASLLHLITLFIVAHYLGPAELGRFALLYFGANLMAHVLTIAVKPGTVRRTFGAGDDEDSDDEDEEEVSASPKRSLGTGLAMAFVLAIVAAAAMIALREPIADLLLGSREDADLVVWAAFLGAATVVFKLVSIVIWFERRPGAFLACELSRPILALVVVLALLAGGSGIEGVLIGNGAGTLLAGVVGVVALRRSFEPAVDRVEVGEILQRGMLRAPIMMSFWTIGNADIFLLSRYVTATELGIYTLASRVGFIAAFMPQGFRVALRPLRTASIYQAVEEQYGRAEQRGQLLGYFVLVCITAVLLMVLLAELVVEIAPGSFVDAAPLIPVTAAAMIWPALLRTVSQQTSWPGRGKTSFVVAAVLAALIFIAVTIALADEIGTYAAPVGIISGLLPPAVYMFVRCQRGPNRIAFPYAQVARALGIAIVIGTGYVLLPDMAFALRTALALALGALYVWLLFRLGAISEAHREALTHMAQSVVSGRTDSFKPRRGLRALEQGERDRLRAGIETSWAARRSVQGRAVRPASLEGLVALLRRVGARGGVPVGAASELDPGIAEYLFSSDPTALRNASMRRLLEAGAEAADLRALEDLISHLATVPDEAWQGRRKQVEKSSAALVD